MSDKFALIVPLTSSNYPTWKVQCQVALMKDGLWGIVNNSETLPDGASADQRSKFGQKKDRALAVTVLSIDPSLLYLIGDPKDPVVVWKALSNQFQKKTWANRLALRHKLHSAKLKDGQPVQEHIKTMMEIFNEMAVVGDNVEADDRVIYLLASLPETFNVLVTALEASSDVPEMDSVIERLLHEEQKLKDRGKSGRATREDALTIKHRKGPQYHFCRKYGHIKKYCRVYEKSQQNNQSRADRSAPQRDGTAHKVNNVKTVGPTDVNSDSDEAGLVVKHVFAVKEASELSQGKWIIDSGATSNICNSDLFVQLFPLEQSVDVRLGMDTL